MVEDHTVYTVLNPASTIDIIWISVHIKLCVSAVSFMALGVPLFYLS